MLYDFMGDTNETKLDSSSPKPHLLLIEDSSALQTITKQILEFYNYEVSFASNGKEGLDLVKKNDYDAILLDLSMPVMDGYECLKKIRSLDDKRKANVPVIAFTGNPEFHTRIELKNKGFNDYIEKPSDYVGVDTMLDKHITEYHRIYGAKKESNTQ
jgi:CheY-like chemotaxis protein